MWTICLRVPTNCPSVFVAATEFPRLMENSVMAQRRQHSLKVHVFKVLSGEAEGMSAVVALAVIVIAVVALIGALT